MKSEVELFEDVAYPRIEIKSSFKPCKQLNPHLKTFLLIRSLEEFSSLYQNLRSIPVSLCILLLKSAKNFIFFFIFSYLQIICLLCFCLLLKINAIQELVTTCEKSLKLVSDDIADQYVVFSMFDYLSVCVFSKNQIEGTRQQMQSMQHNKT
jgi:hypothetical protein